jgi:hypothetical protein
LTAEYVEVQVTARWISAEAKLQGSATQTKALVAAMLSAEYWIDEETLLPCLENVSHLKT